MNTTYQIQSNALGCLVQFKFNNEGILMGFEILEDVAKERILIFLKNVPTTVTAFKDTCKHYKVEITEIMPDLSFENFWNKYNYKEGGSKKKAQQLWEKMSEKDKSAALNYIKKYGDILLKQNVAKLYATTYLNQQRWAN